jgi:hypothetical protein
VRRARWRHSAGTVTSSHPHRQLQISHALPQFPPLISRTLRLLCSTVTAHFTRIACTRRDASQRTARAPSLRSDPETVLTVETASHLETFEPQILVPKLSEKDLLVLHIHSCIILSSLSQYSELPIKLCCHYCGMSTPQVQLIQLYTDL